ncbi:hypothetical protein CONLIGDRAFT_101313 [Coniochaeta ligniaria NRRL 30616]|uniref:Uncharacterized protein n=1 Tax=Coniochaeta ligniaria NRRL 30616 TaxID=1408157 RepID=A0A1J7IU44_9PEZI|nr:hypothetical protein CONLIGDRAFT_101313 [Coniochaeta ligniaria NRRL 30616]
MATADSDTLTWAIANVVLVGIFIKPLFIIWLVSLCLARRKSDHARLGFTWMKVVFPFYTLALLLYVVSGSIYCFTVAWYSDRYSYSSDYDEDTINILYNIELRVSSVGQLFDDVATALLLITLVEIGNGFLYILTQTRTRLQKGLRWATISVGGIIVVLAAAHLGQTNTTWGKYFDYQAGNSDDDYFAVGNFDRELKTIRQLSGAVVILFWVMTLPLIAFASYVVHRVKGIPLLRNSAVIFLVATILLFVRFTWQLAFVATWVLVDAPEGQPIAIGVVDPILTAWVMFVILVLLFVIGIRKKQGLWTTHQPWMANMNQVPGPAVPGQGGWVQGGAYPPQPQPAYQQYPPQQYAYAMPQQQQGWVQQQPMQQYPQALHGQHSPQSSSPPYIPAESPAQELSNGEHREK